MKGSAADSPEKEGGTIKKEYKACRDWCRGGNGRCYKMMIDVLDGSIWSDTFISDNEWKNYKSETIVQIEGLYDTVSASEQRYTEDAIHKLKDAGWTITD